MKNEWQPIETAPRDGTPIWAFTPHGQMTVYFEDYDDGRWIEHRECMQVYATHWMPLPDPPK